MFRREAFFPVAACSGPRHARQVFLHNSCILKIESTLLIACRSLSGNHNQRLLNLAKQDPTLAFPFCVTWPMNLINTWKIPLTPLTPGQAGDLGLWNVLAALRTLGFSMGLGVRPTAMQVLCCSELSDSLLGSRAE